VVGLAVGQRLPAGLFLKRAHVGDQGRPGGFRLGNKEESCVANAVVAAASRPFPVRLLDDARPARIAELKRARPLPGRSVRIAGSGTGREAARRPHSASMTSSFVAETKPPRTILVLYVSAFRKRPARKTLPSASPTTRAIRLFIHHVSRSTGPLRVRSHSVPQREMSIAMPRA